MCIRDSIYTAEDRDIRGAEQDYKKLEKELVKKIKRTPQNHPGYNEYQYHLDPKMCIRDRFSDDLRKLDDDNVYRKLQGHWIIEMSEMMATANAKSIEEIKSFLSRQKEVYKIPYETHPADRPRQCVFGGTSNALDFLPLDRSGNRRFIPVMVYPGQAEVHILEDEAASRALSLIHI